MHGSEASSQDFNTVTGQKSVSGSLGSTVWFKLNQRCQGPNYFKCEECACVCGKYTCPKYTRNFPTVEPQLSLVTTVMYALQSKGKAFSQ